MNNSFSLKRVGLLIGSHWAENKRKYLLSTLALFGGMCVVAFLNISLNSEKEIAPHVQMISYVIVLLVVANIFSSQYFSDLGPRPQAINYLLTPASHAEKTVTALFYTVVVTFVVITALFYLVNALAVTFVNTVHDPQKPSEVINVFSYKSPNSGAAGAGIIASFLCVQSVNLLGSVYFAKYRYLLTAVAVFLVGLVVVLFIQYVLEPIVPDGRLHLSNEPNYVVVNGDGNANQVIPLPRFVSTFFALLPYLLPPILWVATWLRLKEKEV